MFQRLGIRTKLSAFVVLVTLAASAAFTAVLLKVRYDSVIDDTDRKLLMAAHTLKAILPADYIDTIGRKDAVSKDVFDRIVARNDRFCAATGLQYVWSLMLLNGKVVFTSATHADVNNPRSDCASYLEPHTNPEPYRHALETMQPEFTTFHDKWGEGRVVLIPEYDSANRKHLFAASVRLGEFNVAVHRTLLEGTIIGLAIALPAMGLALWLANSLTRPIVQLTRASQRIAQGDLTTELHASGSREVNVLAESFAAMRDAIARQVDSLRREIETRRKAEAELTELREHLKLMVQERTAELLQSRQMLQLVLDNIPVGVFWKDREGSYLGCNRMSAIDAGLTDPQEIVGKTDHELSWKEHASFYRADDRQVIETGHPKLNYEEPLSTADGNRVWIRTSKVPLRDLEGKIIGVMGTYEDITERKEAEEAIRRLNAELEDRVRQRTVELAQVEAIINRSPAVVVRWRATPDWPVEFVTENVWQFGYAPEELTSGRITWNSIIYPNDLPRVDAELNDYIARGLSEFSQRYRLITPTGHTRWVEDRTIAVRDGNGQILRYEGIVLDINDRMKAEEALRMSEDRFRSLVEFLPIGVTVICEGRLVYLNRAAIQLFGAGKPEELLGRSLLDLVPEDRHPVARQDLIQRSSAPHEGALRRLDGQRLDIEVAITPFRHEDRPATLHAFRDITERKQAQDKLRESEKHYAALAERNQRLVQEVEHRVRNNITGLLGLIAMMKSQATDVKSFADTIESRLMAMAHTQRLLAESQWGNVDLATLVNSTLVAMRWMSRYPNPLEMDGPPAELPPGKVMPLALVLVEWFTNSCKHGAQTVPQGRIGLRWELVDGQAGRRLRIRWTESGGPPIEQPPAASLGTALVNSFVTRELQGVCRMSFPPEGADHEIDLPYPG